MLDILKELKECVLFVCSFFVWQIRIFKIFIIFFIFFQRRSKKLLCKQIPQRKKNCCYELAVYIEQIDYIDCITGFIAKKHLSERVSQFKWLLIFINFLPKDTNDGSRFCSSKINFLRYFL